MIKEIEQKYDMWADDYNLNPQDVEWLIKQAERVRELEVWYHSYHKEAKLNNILKIQNKRYREAIEGIENAWKLTNDYQEYMNAIHDIIKELEDEE